MNPFPVSIVRYEEGRGSVAKAVDLCGGLREMPSAARVFLKPNIVFWTRAVPFPKWGVITTSRVIEDLVVLLKERGIDDITIGEGTVTARKKDLEVAAHAFETLGYHTLARRYGVKVFNVFERPFEKVDLGDGVTLNFNEDILHADLVISVPVLKTHNQTRVSLGIKNLKGAIDIASRKRCHSADPVKDLDYMVARLPLRLPPVMAVIDGIYSNERGPSFDGKIRRMNLLIASRDLLSADMVGASVLGYPPSEVPHLVHAANREGRPLDMSDIAIRGEDLASVSAPHAYDFTYAEQADAVLPLPMARQGIKGIYYHKYDLTMCTYCSGLNGLILTAIRNAWKGEAWDRVEVLTGKRMKPTPGMKKTILIGKCMYQTNKDDPNIVEGIAVKGCPPEPTEIVEAFRKAGIPLDPTLFEQADALPGFFMQRYVDRPEFEEAHFRVA